MEEGSAAESHSPVIHLLLLAADLRKEKKLDQNIFSPPKPRHTNTAVLSLMEKT